jgi:hypothetical protein
MMPYSISQQVLTVLLDVVMDFGLKLDLTHYLVYLLIPAVISFWSGVGYIYYRRSY